MVRHFSGLNLNITLCLENILGCNYNITNAAYSLRKGLSIKPHSSTPVLIHPFPGGGGMLTTAAVVNLERRLITPDCSLLHLSALDLFHRAAALILYCRASA